MRLQPYKATREHHENSIRYHGDPLPVGRMVRPAKHASRTLQTFLAGKVNHSPIRDYI